MTTATQVQRPWRTTVRTVFQAVVGFAAASPLIYTAITQEDSATATGAAGTVLLVTGAVTRVMAVPAVEKWLGRFLPFLAADPNGEA